MLGWAGVIARFDAGLEAWPGCSLDRAGGWSGIEAGVDAGLEAVL